MATVEQLLEDALNAYEPEALAWHRRAQAEGRSTDVVALVQAEPARRGVSFVPIAVAVALLGLTLKLLEGGGFRRENVWRTDDPDAPQSRDPWERADLGEQLRAAGPGAVRMLAVGWGTERARVTRATTGRA